MKPASPLSPAEEKHLEILRRMGSVGRLNAAFGLYDFAREHLTVNFRAEHPEWTEAQVHGAVRERLAKIR